MAAADETALKWAWGDYVWEKMERQHCAPEEIAARRRGREEGGVVILDHNNEVGAWTVQTRLPRRPMAEGANKDGGGVQDNDDDNDDGDGGDYTNFYKLFGM
ncbi:Cysteine-rich receptor-like protein kinase 10 [Hordeum vulgare]|nr:Cysteine-rich receptor-like protein kinase 10 [Hordeum vulgare]